jgi:hypothetical protein
MNRNIDKDARKRQRRTALIVGTLVTIAIVALIRYEKIAILYVLATLSLSALLIIVALSDLGELKTSKPSE